MTQQNFTYMVWDEIKPFVVKDLRNLLVGLPVAIFTTTVYQYKRPKTSSYPRGAMTGTKHWRVTIRFNHLKFKIFLMNECKGGNGTEQIHLLYLNEHNLSKAEKFLTTILTHMEKPIDGPKLNWYLL